MRRFSTRLCFILGCAVLSATILTGCVTPSGITPAGTPPSVLNQVCGTTPTAKAHSWVDANRQIVGAINGGPVSQISNFTYPLGLPFEDVMSPTRPGFTAWAPDGKHLATLLEVTNPAGVMSYPFVVDTSTHVATQVQLPANMQMASPIEMEWARERSITWADNNDLLIFAVMPAPLEIGGTSASKTTTYRYNLTAQTLAPLPGVTTAIQGVVRCDTLFYLELSQMKQFQPCTAGPGNTTFYWFLGGASLKRYSLTTQTLLGQPYSLGETASCPDFYHGEVDAMGWDVTADGKKLAYQRTVVAGGQLNNPPGYPAVKTTSEFQVVATNNPGTPTQILAGAVSNANAYLAIAPDQKQVAVVASNSLLIGIPSTPDPLIFTGFLNGGAATKHDPSAGGLPAWYADSTGFDTSALWSETPGVDFPVLQQWQVAAPSAVGTVTGAHHPASLP
jgi:hypothetical protein